MGRMGQTFCSVTLVSKRFPYFCGISKLARKTFYLISVAILNLRRGLCKILLITQFAGVGMELEFIVSSY